MKSKSEVRRSPGNVADRARIDRKSAGDVVAVEAPSGVREYEILQVRYV